MNFHKTLKNDSKDLGNISYSEASLFPVLTAHELLANKKRALLISKVEKLADIHPEDFEILYKNLIHRFVEYVQVIPAFPHHRLGELMDDGLIRGLLAIESCHKEKLTAENPRLTYAIFSAALLLDIAKIATQQRMMVSDEEGKFIAEWTPYGQSLVGQASYYKIRFLGPGQAQLGEKISPLIARQVMPQLGFLFLAEDYQILHMWLAMLSGDERSARVLGDLLSRVKEKLAAQKELLGFSEIEMVLKEPDEVKMAEDFLAWLKENLDKNNVKVNQRDANIFVVNDGVFLDSKLFQQFCDTYRGQPNWIVLMKQFNHLGISKKSGEDVKFDQYFSEAPDSYTKQSFIAAKSGASTPYQTKRQGIVVTKADLLLTKGAYAVDKHLNPANGSNLAAQRLVQELPKAEPPPLRTRPP